MKYAPLTMTVVAGSLLFFCSNAQVNAIYQNLPVGKYSVGFKIFTITDETRVEKPEYNYLGEKNEGDRRKKLTVHLWYPAEANTGTRPLTYADYCYNSLLNNTTEAIDPARKEGEIAGRRRSVENWFGKTTDENWKKLLESDMLARIDASPLNEKFPLLIGILRSLSTSVTNEMLASNGYIVAMIDDRARTGPFYEAALSEIPDMQFTLTYLERKVNADIDKLGSFGFSGSGFSQVLFAMYDYRVKAVADIESGIYMDNLYQNFAASDYYQPAKLRAPFLHIFSRDLSKQEKFIGDFENKTKFAPRYRLLLNQPVLHHWDFASEGFTSTIFLNNRGEQTNNIRQSFVIASAYLLNFFNAELKGEANSKTFLSTRPSLPNTAPALWDITSFAAAQPAPDREAFELIINKKGIDKAIAIVKTTIAGDSLTDLNAWYILNGMGYGFLNQKKYKEAIAIFKLNTELHPTDPNLFDSLAEAYELSGDKENMKKASATQMELLNKKDSLSDFDKGLKSNAEKRLK